MRNRLSSLIQLDKASTEKRTLKERTFHLVGTVQKNEVLDSVQWDVERFAPKVRDATVLAMLFVMIAVTLNDYLS